VNYNVIDSSAWLEYYSEGSNIEIFAPVIEKRSLLIVPSIVIYEVHKFAQRQRDDHPVRAAVAKMEEAKVIYLDSFLAKYAAELSLELNLPMADSIILATARMYDAKVWTQDSDFKDILGVEYHPKRLKK
jgi:toxin FitB